MDRLTAQWGGNPAVPKNINYDFLLDLDDETAKGLQAIVDRLAVYENTRYSPEDFDALCREMSNIRTSMGYATFEELQSSISQTSLLRLRELMDADRRGRLVTLPCKVGDTVYRVIRSKDKDGGHITSAVVSGIHMADGRRYKKREAYIVLKVNGRYVSHVPLSNFGKTVFLTQVDAKAALQGEF